MKGKKKCSCEQDYAALYAKYVAPELKRKMAYDEIERIGKYINSPLYSDVRSIFFLLLPLTLYLIGVNLVVVLLFSIPILTALLNPGESDGDKARNNLIARYKKLTEIINEE